MQGLQPLVIELDPIPDPTALPLDSLGQVSLDR